MPMPPTRPPARSDKISPNIFSMTSTSSSHGFYQLQCLCIYIGIVFRNIREVVSAFIKNFGEKRKGLKHIGFIHAGNIPLPPDDLRALPGEQNHIIFL